MSADREGVGQDVNALAAALRSHGSDTSLYAGMLLNTLSSSLPAHMVTVERAGGGRLFRRHKDPAITSVTIEVGDRRFRLERAEPGGLPTATLEHVVRGIVLSKDDLPLVAWSDALAGELARAAARDAGVARAIDRLITGV
jgi:hypothetical protein